MAGRRPERAIEAYEKNQKIFSQGDVADAVFFIQRARSRSRSCPSTARKRWSGILAEGQFFGEACLESAKLRTATSHAMEECLITSITKQAMLAALAAEPKFSDVLHRLSAVPKQPDRRRPDRPAVQFQRKAAGAPAAAARQFRPGWRRAADRDHSQSGNPGGNDRHHPVPGEFLHEPVPKTGIHRATTEKSKFTVRCWTPCCATSRKSEEDE